MVRPLHYPIDAAPILRFDRKGAFSILPGNGIAEAILRSAAAGDDRRFAELRDHLDRHGLHIVPTLVAAIRLPICSPTPQTVYEQLLATISPRSFGGRASPNTGGPVQILATERYLGRRRPKWAIDFNIFIFY